ncbi:N-acetylmuramoyl-L-alanine amidase [Candidatus Contubernalis alkaliaceticus]|uniref:N-acetylmuramoyl-L-alanine amidase n=1 Tax=Candidatus Contubernalis alkaliaceticus TaxID=338645 RepID=UPI001F4BEEE5|nr:N-acetylmuramoyl-L-alanine amidase [Candidatus Contubernalis alkalaceticus]UNC91707.1 N-acetylmuramoyl-L-alanine amidase [Candidatus Contubernalis alkalaceticus]
MEMVNVLLTTDVYKPSDLDDDIDLMTCYGLHCAGEINLLAVNIDVPHRPITHPGSIFVEKLNQVCNLNIPHGEGPGHILETLQASPGQVTVIVVGSVTALWQAYLQNPNLCRSRIEAVWMFAGDAQENPARGHRDGKSYFPGGLEYNVAIDPPAFTGIMGSDLQIVWVPCFDGGLPRPNTSDGEQMKHAGFHFSRYDKLFEKASNQVRDFYIGALSTERPEGGLYPWELIRGHFKDLFGAGIFRAIPRPDLSYPFRFISVSIRANTNGTISRDMPGGKQVLLFERTDMSNFYTRMTGVTADILAHIRRMEEAPPQEEDDIMIDFSGFPYPVKPADFPMDLSRMTERDPKKMKYCIWHHTGVATDSSAANTNTYHRNNNGWPGIGYHAQIRFSGQVELGRPLNKQGAHTLHHNHESIGVCLSGNFSQENLLSRPEQYSSAVELAKKISQAVPGITHVRHKDLRPTECPGSNFPWEKFIEDVSSEAVGTLIIGEPRVSVGQAKEWARNRGAHQRFIDIAPVYWAYGEQTGIRPEILYAQSAKETAFGRYTGVVPASYNNWAGIKTREATGDKPEDHQQFSTPEEGVRAHFNHISAYVGLEPIGEPHGRYYLVLTIAWAGTVKNVEEMSGKWAPAADYGPSVVRDYLVGLMDTEEPPHGEPGNPEEEHCSKCAELEDHIGQLDALLDQKEKKIHALEASMRLIAAESTKLI